MYCPQCRCEYRDGFTECCDCHVPLSSGTPPPEPAVHSTPLLGLVVVLETSDRIQLALAKGLLEDAGIPFFALGQIATLVQDVDPFLHKVVRVQVPRDREAEARELLEQLFAAETSPPGAGENT
jgi:Putative prokaryotic signal transducing protein